MKPCTVCGLAEPDVEFGTASGRRRSACKACVARRQRGYSKRAARDSREPARQQSRVLADGPNLRAFDAEDEASADAAERRASDFAALRPEDFDVGLGGDPRVSHIAGNNRAERAQASREKRQEYSAAMGRFATDLRDAAAAAPEAGGVALPPAHAPYIAALAEQERRYGNRRWARSIAIAEAHEELSRQAAVFIAERHFSAKVEPAGYARIAPDRVGSRTACLLLSDLHLGAELDSLDEPVSFTAIEEARRLEYVLRQFVDYKPQYRDRTDALLVINGDIIEGQLMHDFRAGAPLAEQKAIFWAYFREFVAQVARAYKRVRVVCQPGNHGRDKVRHPGRATARKWDGHEWECYIALRAMCSDLRNVEWSIPFRAISDIEVHGSHLLATHADTEVKLGHPDLKAKENARVLDRINSTRTYGVEFDGAVFGHYHTPRYIPGRPRVLWNGALVPPNGHARSSAYIGEPCGQFMWEAVEGYPIGDVRFIEVGESQDRDERLGTIIKPFRFSGTE